MKLYSINGKIYEMCSSRNEIGSVCWKCEFHNTNKKRRYCPSEILLRKCNKLGYDKYFKEVNNVDLKNYEVVVIMEKKDKYTKMKKGFTRRDVLRELILELKSKLGVDRVRKCDSVDQCKEVIDEIIKIACNCELSSAKDLIARKDTALKVQEDVRRNLYKQLNGKDGQVKALREQIKEIEKSRDGWAKLAGDNEIELQKLETKNKELEKDAKEWEKIATDNAKAYREKQSEYDELRAKYQLEISTNKEERKILKETIDRLNLALINEEHKLLFSIIKERFIKLLRGL